MLRMRESGWLRWSAAFLLGVAAVFTLGAVIQSGASSDNLTIDPTSKAARVSIYDSRGNFRGVKATYSAATVNNVVAAASTQPFLNICGSGSKTIIVRRVVLSGPTLTAVAYNSYEARKYSTAPTGGTATALTATSHDSNDAAPSATLVQVYTAAPTAGTLVGTVANRRVLMQATTAAAAGIPDLVAISWESDETTTGIYLRGTGQCVGVGFGAAPATAVTLAAEVEWTEE